MRMRAALRVADDEALALEHRDAERARSARAGPAVDCVNVAAVELVVAGDEDDRLRPAAKALERRPSALSMSPARTSSSAPGAGSGSYGSVSRCRSESSCSRIRTRAGSAVALLELRAAAARAGVVAADLGRVAAHRVDLVAQRRGQLVQLGDAADDLVDRLVERSERALARRPGRRCRARRRFRGGSGTGAPASSRPRDRRARRGPAGDGRPARSRRPRAGARRRSDRRRRRIGGSRGRASASARLRLGRRLRRRPRG